MGLCVHAYVFVCVCLSLKVSASFQVYGRPVSVFTIGGLSLVQMSDDAALVTDDHTVSLHRSLGSMVHSVQ